MKSDKIVTTINGENVPRGETRYIKGEYYKIGDTKVKNSGDCYLVDGKYRRISTGYIIYDHSINEYVVYNMEDFIKNQIIGFDEKDNPVYGDFSLNDQNRDLFVVIEGNKYNLVNEEIIKECKSYSEDLSTGVYYSRQALPANRFIAPQKCNRDYKMRLDYDSRGIMDSKIKLFNRFRKKQDVHPLVKKVTKHLGGLSFGLEFETIKGFVPDRICNKTGLIPLRDGSVQGLEYVTIPLQEEDGVQALIESVSELKKRTEYDDSCSLHLHIGNVPRTEEFLLALFKVLCYIQEDVYNLFPLYKKYNFGFKRKNYTKPLPSVSLLSLLDKKIDKDNIKENFSHLFQFLSMNIPYSEYNNNLDNVKSHPSDPEGRRKWQITSRYHWVNLIPLVFGNKKTIEFRIHTPTYDVNKVMNYLLLCTTIINYTKKNQDKILKNAEDFSTLNINTMLFDMDYPSGIVEDVTYYLRNRENFIHTRNKAGDFKACEDSFYHNSSRCTYNWEKVLKNGKVLDYKEVSGSSTKTEGFENNIFNDDEHRRIQELHRRLRDGQRDGIIYGNRPPQPVPVRRRNIDAVENDHF